MTVRILSGHVLDKLAEIAPNSVQLVCTSPPYYGLRSYGTEPQVWAGDNACPHEWGVERIIPKSIRNGQGATTLQESGPHGTRKHGEQLIEKLSANVITSQSTGSFCQFCTAWRGELGQEPTLALYLDHLLMVFDAVRRVLRSDGCLFVNLGDSYATTGTRQGNRSGGIRPEGKTDEHRKGIASNARSKGFKEKDLMLVPHRFAIAMQDAGWWVRNDLVWAKTACMPESVTDRATRSHEYIFHFAKNQTYYYDSSAVAEPSGGRPDVPSVIERPNLRNQRVVLGNDFGSEHRSLVGSLTPSRLTHAQRIFEVAVRVASSILDRSECEQQFSLTALDTKIGQECLGDDNGGFVGCSPEEHRAAVLATSFLAADMAPKGFLEEINRLSVALPDSDVLRVARGIALDADTPKINGNADTAIRVDDTGEIGENKWVIHNQEYTTEATTSQKKQEGHGRRHAGFNARWDAAEAAGKVGTTRNQRTVWTISPEPLSEAHFASWPTEIPRRCILAGSSEKGQCPACGAPWVRVVERNSPRTSEEYRALSQAPKDVEAYRSGQSQTRGAPSSGLARAGWREFAQASSETTGWSPSCACDAGDPIPQTILDPFIGSGRTGIVADRLGRNCIGIELSPKNVAMSERLIRGDSPMFAVVEVA